MFLRSDPTALLFWNLSLWSSVKEKRNGDKTPPLLNYLIPTQTALKSIRIMRIRIVASEMTDVNVIWQNRMAYDRGRRIPASNSHDNSNFS